MSKDEIHIIDPFLSYIIYLFQPLKYVFDPTMDYFNLKIPLLWRISLLVSILGINIIRTTTNKENVLTWNFLLSGLFQTSHLLIVTVSVDSTEQIIYRS